MTLFPLILATFAASAVEMVEALTIVLAVGATKGWRVALSGAGLALAILAAAIAAGGVPLVRLVPVAPLRLAFGSLTLYMGIKWGRKAILRATGRKAKHNEDAAYAEAVIALSGRDRRTAFSTAFRGVLLEGFEVVLIVVSLGAAQHRIGVAALGALAALVVVAGVGLAVGRQLAQVPENTLKMVVSVLLVAFGTFWVGESAGIRWPGADAFMLVLIGLVALSAMAVVALLRVPAGAAVPHCDEMSTSARQGGL